MSRKKYYNSGFSLIEMVVAIGVFAVAVIIGGGVVLAVMVTQDKSIGIQTVQDNMAFALESMGKEIRTGKFYHCGESRTDVSSAPRDCPPNDPPPYGDGGLSFTFLNALGQTVTYRLTAPIDEKQQMEKSTDGGATFLPITSPDVDIDKLMFYVSGSSVVDNNQPSVIIVLSAKVGERFVAEINLQTTITQRVLDI